TQPAASSLIRSTRSADMPASAGVPERRCDMSLLDCSRDGVDEEVDARADISIDPRSHVYAEIAADEIISRVKGKLERAVAPMVESARRTEARHVSPILLAVNGPTVAPGGFGVKFTQVG